MEEFAALSPASKIISSIGMPLPFVLTTGV